MRTETAAGKMGARYLSQIQEESDSREHSTCYLPAIAQEQQTGGAGKPGVVKAPRQEVKRRSYSISLPVYDGQKRQEKKTSLLEELTRIEADLRETRRLDQHQQQEVEFLRQQENKLMWQNLHFLSLSQRVAKPWVSSYFKTFPMHIYCLPVQSSSHKGRRWGGQKRRK